MNITIYGLMDHLIYRDARTGYSFFRVRATDGTPHRRSDGTVSVRCTCPKPDMYIPLELQGEWEKDKKGNWQFAATRIKIKPVDEMAAAVYLSSGKFPGIGKATADAITKEFPDIFSRCSEPDLPSRISEKIRGLGYEQAAILCQTLRENVGQQELFAYLLKYGVTLSTTMKLYEEFTAEAKEKLEENPYEGIRYGMSFEQCDRIAKDMGYSNLSARRIGTAVSAALQESAGKGNTWTPFRKAVRGAQRFLGDIPAVAITACGMIDNQKVITERIAGETETRVYPKYLWAAEKRAAEHLKRLSHNAAELGIDQKLIILSAENTGIRYSEEQIRCFELLKDTAPGIITGGPGTGKTTVIKGLIYAYQAMCPSKAVALCAPTGRAAQRMSEATGMVAETIHRLLEFRPCGKELTHKDGNDPVEAGLIIVDESSMIDVELLDLFLAAVSNGTKVIFIGDRDQLPPVGAGDVLTDMLASGVINSRTLTQIHRQEDGSRIVLNASRINGGYDSLEEGSDFHMETFSSSDAVAKRSVELAVSLYDKKDPFGVQLLAPSHKGIAGVSALNIELQERLNPPKEGVHELRYGKHIFRVGDKVLLTANNYELGYFNGDIGVVSQASEDGVSVLLEERELELPLEVMEDLSLAYAMTVHKSQGSEYGTVILALPYDPAVMLKRNLLYTAVTRAKQKAVVIAETGAVSKAVRTRDTGVRYTSLKDRLLCSN